MGVVWRRNRDWKTHFQQGMAAGRDGRLQAAAAHFRKAIKTAPDEPYPHYELGYTLMLLGQHAAALPELKRTNELSPGFFLVQTEILMCEAVLSGAIDDHALALLRQLQRLGDTGRSQSADAATLCRQVIEAAPDFALGHYFLGKALFNADKDRSEAALRRCVELGPDDTTAIDALTHIGLHRDTAGDSETACGIWRDVLARYPGNPHAQLTELVLSQRCTD